MPETSTTDSQRRKLHETSSTFSAFRRSCQCICRQTENSNSSGTKPLGTGCNPGSDAQCVGVPVKEFRASVARPFQDGRFNVGVNLSVAKGFTGQTLESFYPVHCFGSDQDPHPIFRECELHV